ncbi:MAG: response regulator [Desulfovibrio sp.]|nr:response regulator [Desulfovibrio sp.]MCA1987228.1 response regulator [Desulfovibrio sp.]
MAPAEPVAASSVPTQQGPRKVLIVDDEPHIRMLLEETLESLEDDGVVLLYAENGEDGLALIRQEQPSLVFLDVMMPRMNGFDVCDWTKNKLALDGVYVVMLTAKGQEFDSQRGMEAGADVYMTKPFRPAEVLTLARTVLGME